MTSLLRRKRPTTLLPALTLASALVAGSVNGGEPEPRVLPPLRPNAGDVTHKRLAEIRHKRREIIQTQAQEPIPTQIGPGSDRALEDDYYFEIETKPPTRDRLFTLGSESFVLNNIERDFKEKDPGQVFLLPAPIDRFDINDSLNLGPSWFQNRETGVVDPESDRKGEMRIINRVGVFPAGAKPEVSIINESVGSPNVFVTVDINLGNPDNKFGLVFRANDPNLLPTGSDQIKVNSFYYVLLSADTVTLGKSEKGIETVIKPAAKITPKAAFNLAVTTFGDQITVLRDGEVILEATDNTLNGDFVGMYGAAAILQPVTFNNFFGMRFGGPFLARQFLPSQGDFYAGSVHHHPLYFEQLTVERYGQSMGNLVQPWISNVMFYADFFSLPYSLAKTPPWECLSNEGYAQPGDIVLPFRVLCPVYDNKGMALQLAVMALTWSLIP
ncbi:MAG: hypothetical protein U1D30_24405 [Planctomycetota bacterium]